MAKNTSQPTSKPNSLPGAGQARREAILDATVSLLAEVGYHGLSMRDIALRVGISHPGIIYHFPSKESLVRAVIERAEKRSMFAFVLDEKTAPLDVLQGFLELLLQLKNASEIIELDCLMAVEASSPAHPGHEYFANRFRTLLRGLVRVFKELQTQGLLNQQAPAEYLANSLLAQWYGLQIQRLYDPASVNIKEMFTRMIMRLLDLQKPETKAAIFSSSLASAQVVELMEQLAGVDFKGLVEHGFINLSNQQQMRYFGMDKVPVDILKRLVQADLMTVAELRHCERTEKLNVEMLSRAVLAGILSVKDLQELALHKVASKEAVSALITVVNAGIKMAE